MAGMVGTSLTDPSLAPALDRDDEDDDRTPQGQPEPTPPAATSSDKPADTVPGNANLLGEYTRSRQEIAEIRDALGLPKSAKKDDILAAVRQRQSVEAGGEPEDPVMAQRLADIREREWRAVTHLYGGWAEAAKSLVDKFRTSDDPEELTTHLFSLVEGLAKSKPDDAAPAQDDEPEHVDIPLGESDPGPTQRQVQQAAAERGQGSGNVASAVRGLFERAGVVKRVETVTYDDE